MPYLDSKIDKHKNNCTNPVGKRLYIRDYDDEGKQRFAPWGLTCTTCGVVVKQQYQRNLPNGQKHWFENLSKEAYEHHLKYKVKEKLERQHRRRQGGGPITPEENGLRIRIRNYEKFYTREYMVYRDKMKELIDWPPGLSATLLNLIPRPSMNELSKVVWPLGWDPHKHRNMIDDPDRPGYLKYDTSPWIPDPENPGKMKYQYHDNPDFLSDYEKLLVEELQKRKEIMKEIIKSRGVEFRETTVKRKPEKKKTYAELLEGIRGKTKR